MSNEGLTGSYRDLRVWDKAMDLADAIYDLAALLPDDEKYALVSQIKRASVSVPSNIAEGYGRMSKGDYVHHLRIANGSRKEVEAQLIFAGRRKFVSRDEARQCWELLQEVGKMLLALIRSLT